MTPRRIRLGMVGGGGGAFIGAVHRMALRLDDAFTLDAACLASDPERARADAAALGIAPERAYGSWAEMAEGEAARRARSKDAIDAVIVATPNHLHVPVAQGFIALGFDVLCEKPLATLLADARALHALASARGRLLGVAHTYAGYPMVRAARELVAAGELGALRFVHVEYAQDWLAGPLEATGHKQAAWRLDPLRAGPAGALGDIGTHAAHLAGYVTGLSITAVSARLHRFVPGRALDDHVQAQLQLQDGALGLLWASQVAAGEANALRLRVYGERASLSFDQEEPDSLWLRPVGGPARRLRRGEAATAAASPAAAAATRLPPGHPEGYVEAMAQLYRDFAALWHAREQGTAPPAWAAATPGGAAGVQGLAFIEAVLRSDAQAQAWVPLDTV